MNLLRYTISISVLAFFLAACNGNDTVRVNVSDFGLEPGTGKNSTPFIIKALEECKKHQNPVLEFKKGRYDFMIDPDHTRAYFESNTTNNGPKNLAILIEGFHQLTLDGKDAEFVFHGAIQPISVDNSRNITIRNLNIDWDIPLTAQARVLAASPKNIELEIDTKQFPYEVTDSKLIFIGENWKAESRWFMEYVADKHLIAPGTGDNGAIRGDRKSYWMEEIKPGVVRMNGDFTRTPAVGNYLILRHSKRDHAGIFIQESQDVKIENVNIYHCAGLGVLAQFSRNLDYNRVRFMPNIAKNRYFSGHDDGFQVSNCAGNVNIRNCEFGGLMDDPVNVHGTSVKIIEKLGHNRLRCRFMHEQSDGMIWGHLNDTIGFLENESMATLSAGTLKSFESVSREEFVVEFYAPIPSQVDVGDALENLSWSPSLVVQDCRFNSCRARGLLVSTPGKVLIDRNQFESSGSAILIAGDANGWYESGAVRNVTISNNTFKEACMTSMYQFCEGIISIYPIIPAVDSLKPYHRNINITQNTFNAFDYPVLYALSVDSISFTANKIVRSHAFEPFHNRKHCLTFEACLHVEVKRNVFEGEVLAKDIRPEKMDPNQINSVLY